MKENFEPYVDDTGVFGFFGDYRFLSNFWGCRIQLDDLLFTSAEAAYQSLKTDSWREKQMISEMTPGEAKKYSCIMKVRKDWEINKEWSMLLVVTAKFQQNLYLAERLKSLSGLYLEETNYWKDTYWGVCDGVGHNKLGKILMYVRDNVLP